MGFQYVVLVEVDTYGIYGQQSTERALALQPPANERARDQVGTYSPSKVGGWPILAVRGKRAAQAQVSCEGAKWVGFNTEPRHDLPCEIVHPGTLRDSGAIALYRTENGIRTVSARQITGTRLWNAQ